MDNDIGVIKFRRLATLHSFRECEEEGITLKAIIPNPQNPTRAY